MRGAFTEAGGFKFPRDLISPPAPVPIMSLLTTSWMGVGRGCKCGGMIRGSTGISGYECCRPLLVLGLLLLLALLRSIVAIVRGAGRL